MTDDGRTTLVGRLQVLILRQCEPLNWENCLMYPASPIPPKFLAASCNNWSKTLSIQPDETESVTLSQRPPLSLCLPYPSTLIIRCITLHFTTVNYLVLWPGAWAMKATVSSFLVEKKCGPHTSTNPFFSLRFQKSPTLLTRVAILLMKRHVSCPKPTDCTYSTRHSLYALPSYYQPNYFKTATKIYIQNLKSNSSILLHKIISLRLIF